MIRIKNGRRANGYKMFQTILLKRIFFALLVISLSALVFSGCDKSGNKSGDTPIEEKKSDSLKETSQYEKRKNEDAQQVVDKKEENNEPAVPEKYYTIYNFLDNRPLAHSLYQNVVVAAADSDAFRRNHWGNHAGQWTNVKIDNQPVVALLKRRDGQLQGPSEVPNPNGLRLRVYNPVDNAKNVLKVKLNGKNLEPKTLEKGWSWVGWELTDEGALENTLDLEFSGLGRIDGNLSGGAIAEFEIGDFDFAKWTESVKGQDAKNSLTKNLRLADEQGPFSLSEETGAMFYFFKEPRTQLKVAISGADNCGVKLVLSQAVDKKLTDVKEYELKVKDGKADGVFAIDGAVGAASRLVLRPLVGCASVKIDGLDLIVEGEKPARKQFEPPKHILVWMIDTLRSDHLPIHFETDVEAPNLKKLADEGASFKWGIVQGNESKTSHASFFTGMYPARHRVLVKGILKPEHELLSEALKKAGYKTAGYMGNGYISKPFGFEQGWDFFRNNLREQLGITAAGLRNDAESYMTKNGDQKFFLYVGTIDPHVTYRAHEGIIEKYAEKGYNGQFKNYLSGEALGKIKGHPEKVSEADRKQALALYKNEIEYNDREFGKLRAFMEEKGIWKDTLVVITADHGDEFWEHGSVGHGHSAYDELVHVPIIMYYPPAIDAGVKPTTGADVLDIYPTIIDIVGGELDKGVQGRSFLPYLDKKAVVYPEPGIGTRYLNHYAFQVGPWSLLLKKGEFTFYDNEKDVTEQNDVAMKHPFELRAIADGVSYYVGSDKMWDKKTWGVPTNLSPNFLKLFKTN